ncbi:MAG: hypothetical protein ACREEM_46235, partial [Blastocatellia bacterium]
MMTTDSFTEQAAAALADFRRQRETGRLRLEAVRDSAMRAAEMVIAHHRKNGQLLRDAVALLCEIIAHPDPQAAGAGVQALFPALVERLNDSFEPANCELYDQIFAQVIEFYRGLPEAAAFDRALRDFGLMNESDLLTRKCRLAIPQSSILNPQSSILKILLPSRVTIGADVAITSVIIAKLRDVFPGAEFVLLGSRKLRELFGGDSRIRVREIAYGRGASLLSRLMSWLDVVEAVNEELRGLKPEEFLVIDPDSRLTQLGLLPLVEKDRNHLFFESRSFQREGATHIGQLASRWLNEVFDLQGDAFPFVALPREHRRFGQTIATSLRHDGPARLIAVSFGAGGNHRKRISDEFERGLVEQLLTCSKIILDKGADDAEREQINRIVASLRRQGRTIVEMNEQNASA